MNISGETLSELSSEEAFYSRRVPSVVMLVTFCVIGTPGNIMVLLVQWREKTMTTTQFYIFVIAIIDLITCVLAIPMNVVFLVYWLRIRSVSFCKFLWTINISTVCPGVYMVLGLSVVRYCHMCVPHKLQRVEKNSKYILLYAFLVTMTFTIIQGVMRGKQTWPDDDQNLPGFRCNIREGIRNSYKYVMAVSVTGFTFLFSLTTSAVLNFFVLKTMIRQKRLLSRYRSTTYPTSKPLKISFAAINTRKSYGEAAFEEAKSSTFVELYVKPRSTSELDDSCISDMKKEDSVENSKLSQSEAAKTRSKSQRFASVVETEIASKKNSGDKEENAKNLDIQKTKFAIDHESKQSQKSGGSKSNSTMGKAEEKLNEVEILQKKKRSRNYSKRKSTRKSRKGTTNLNGQTLNGREQCRKFCCQVQPMNISFFKVLIVNSMYIMTYMPYFVANAYINIGERKAESTAHLLFMYLLLPSIYLPYFRCAASPLIYYFLDPSFRRKCRALIDYVCGREVCSP